MKTDHYCPTCGDVQPAGRFKPNPAEKGVKRFMSVSIGDGGRTIHGYSDTLEMARAAICQGDTMMPNAVILERESDGKEAR